MPATSAAVQVLPLVALVLIPILTLRLFAFFRPRARSAGMALGALLPWNWGYSPHEKDSRDSTAKKRRVRTRAEQVAEHKKNGASERGGDDDAHFPGLVNMSGTHCFMNSTLQVCSLSFHSRMFQSFRRGAICGLVLRIWSVLGGPILDDRPPCWRWLFSCRVIATLSAPMTRGARAMLASLATVSCGRILREPQRVANSAESPFIGVGNLELSRRIPCGNGFSFRSLSWGSFHLRNGMWSIRH
jgi:hypothetical protein